MTTQIQTATAPDEDVAEVEKKNGQTITLPRRIVYFQAALLGIIATTFFVFGMMVGTLTSRYSVQPEIIDCEVNGTVSIQTEEGRVGDAGAVVMLLPANRTPERRMNPRTIHPDDFDSTDNPIITTIQELGGAIVRTNAEGKFSVVVDSPNKYDVIVVSKNSATDGSFTKKQMATVSTYFMPVETLRDGKAIYTSTIRVEGKSKRLDVNFSAS